MKTKFFKIVLPAFTFALAIVASFAFTPTHNAAVDAYYKDSNGDCQLTQQDVDCVTQIGPACTITVESVSPFPINAYNVNCDRLYLPQ